MTSRLFRVIVLLALVTACTASAQTLPKISFEKYTLANGLQVILSVDRKIPAVNVNLWYHVGSKNEAPGKTGFAHLFEHMMFQGSKHVVGEYLQLAEQAGANLRAGGVNGTTSQDRTNYFETVPSSSLEYALWLESDRMGFLDDALTEEKFRNQQDVVKNEKRQGDNNPYAVLQYLVSENLYPVGHPYAHTVIGSIDDLTNATLDDVRSFFNTWYVPNNCTLTLVGDFDPAEAKQLIKKYFGPLAPGEPLSRPGVNIPVLASTKRVHAKDRSPQGLLVLVYPTPQMFSREEAPLDAAATVLGGGKSSILYKRLVRELELATSVAVYNSCSEISGEFTIRVQARPGKSLEEIRTVIDEEIAAFAKRGPTPEDLQRERAQRAMDFISGLERIGGFGGVADRLNQYNTFLGTPDYFQQDYDRYMKVTAADVTREFTRWIAQAHRLEVYITPEQSGRPDAAEFDRSVPPATGSTVSFAAPQTEARKLPNGLDVVVARRAGLPLVSAQLVIRSGNILEDDDHAGESMLTAAMLDEGTTTRSALKIRDDLDLLGSSLGVGGGKTGSAMTIGSLKQHLDATMGIMADVVLHPTFPADEFARVQKQTLDALLQMRSNPSAIASQVFNKMLYGAGHPLGRSSSGTEASVKKLGVDDLRRNYESFWRPNNAALVFVGDVTIDEAVALATKHLGAWKQATLPPLTLPAYSAPKEHVVYLVDRQNAPQSQIRIGSTAPDRYTRHYYDLQMTNALLGGAFSSRLNLNLREEKGYTYGAFSSMTNARSYGNWVASAGVQTKFTKESLVEFRREILGIAGERPVTEDELDGMQRNLTRGYVQLFESNGQVLGEIASFVNYGLPVIDLEKYVPAMEQQTAAGVMETAKKYFSFDNAITVVVGDRAVIEEGIRSLGWGRVVVVDADGNPIE
jgi:zinc protease